jgi:hypothetical protein
VLLVGGPGNGKSEAIEETIKVLESTLEVGTLAQDQLRPFFNPVDGTTAPRTAEITLSSSNLPDGCLTLTLVQDASVGDPKFTGRNSAELLAEDIERALAAGTNHFYFACVNRGVLDGAFIAATESGSEYPRRLLEQVVRAAGIDPLAPNCWPLDGYPEVAVWPMDIESLIEQQPHRDANPQASPAEQLLEIALDETRWPTFGSCAAGTRCPHCISRRILSSPERTQSLLQVLRWYELASGKRWSFRDLLSLTSFLLAGAPDDGKMAGRTPCELAAYLIKIDTNPTSGVSASIKYAAPFLLVAAQYQHTLFNAWPRLDRRGLRPELKELQLENDATLLGLHHFLSMDRGASIPSSLRSQLPSLSGHLDPALAHPDEQIDVSAKTRLRLGDIDARFSFGVREGLNFIRRYHALSELEVDLLGRLAEVRRRNTATATQLQAILRDFACRMVRRSLGVRAGVVFGHETLRQFTKLIGGDQLLSYTVSKSVQGLLNQDQRFVVDLNTTFGEPSPPSARRVWLAANEQKVKPLITKVEGRPASDVRFLQVGSEASKQQIVLNYDLFRSVTDLQAGLTPSSLPKPVKAALDAARARLAGVIVRDDEQLDGAEIHIGVTDEVITRQLDQFIVTRKDAD